MTLKRSIAPWLAGLAVVCAQAVAQDARPVKVEPLSALLTPVVHTASAEVVSANRSRISAQIEARIESIAVDVGHEVERNQLIVELDCSEHELALQRVEAELQSAESRLQRARQQLTRSESLARDTLLSEDLLEQRQTESEAAAADVRRARVAVQQAELTVERCGIESPFDGAVTERLASRGELARPGTPLLEIVDLRSVEVSAEIFPAEQSDLRDSAVIAFRFLDHDYPLRIERFSPVIDPLSRTMEARLSFSGRPAPVGASGRLVWRGPNPGVPASLLVQRDDTLGVFVARNGKAAFHELPGAQEGRPAAVDLPPGTLLVTEGRQGLSDGDPLNVID